VREALLMLEGEGLLRLIPNRGAYVPAISDREIAEVTEARLLVEVFCAQRVAESGPEIAAALQELITAQERLFDDVDAFKECDRSFHRTIVDAADHRIFSGLYESMRDRQRRMGVNALMSNRARAEQVVAEHRAIAAALAARDPESIDAAITTHIRETVHALCAARRPV
jgi:DNA-binding GntR family transcriptional regulator